MRCSVNKSTYDLQGVAVAYLLKTFYLELFMKDPLFVWHTYIDGWAMETKEKSADLLRKKVLKYKN